MRDDISSLMDGEYDAGRAQGLIERIGRDDEARDLWATYHLIGDALRGEANLRAGVQDRIFDRLAGEPTVLAPRRWAASPGRTVRVGMAVAASVATISVVAWMAGQDVNQPTSVAQNAPAAAVAQVPMEAVQPAANLSEYLSAHEEFSSSTAGYRLANVSTVAPASGAAGR